MRSLSLCVNIHRATILLFSVLLIWSGTARAANPQQGISEPTNLDKPFLVQDSPLTNGALEVRLDAVVYDELNTGPAERLVLFPLSSTEEISLELTRFEVVTSSARFLLADQNGATETQIPDVVLLRGRVTGQPQSHAFIALTESGSGNGSVTLEDGRKFVLSPDSSAGVRDLGQLVIRPQLAGDPLPEFERFCGLEDLADPAPLSIRATPKSAVRGTGANPGPRVVVVAIDADQTYVDMFADATAAEAYAIQLIGAISDIYMRDFNCKLMIDFLRLWPAGGEPFSADDLAGFAGHWLDNEDMTGLNLIHMFSGRRDTSYGGVAYVSGACSGIAVGISSFMLGEYPEPPGAPHLFNWDLIVVAHEMGHNMGTNHTHFGYVPHIDDCASNFFSLGTIMSYCHLLPGGVLNIDLRFHSRVQDFVDGVNDTDGCLWYDCNDNGIDDAVDVAGATSVDANSNGVPDECEDCNGNSTLDDADITGGMPDVNSNGLPDGCEADCDGNKVPDSWDIVGGSADANGNRLPDICEADCDGSSVADVIEIDAQMLDDLDRNRIPDVCEDCNGNSTTDWVDLGSPFNVYVADLNDYVREYHGLSGVPVQSLASGVVINPHDVVFGPDGQLYVASFGTHSIVRIDVDTGTTATFVSAGSGGLSGPAGLVFGDNGNLFVSSNGTSSVIEYDGVSGALVGTFVSSGSGGLTSPYGLTFGPNGNLFVTSSDDTVQEYNGASGALIGTFVTTGSGGLSGPRGLAFKPNGQLLVTSTNNDLVLEYDASGASVGVFNDLYPPTGAWGVKIGPNGNVFVARNTGTIRILEYEVDTGRFMRSFIRGDGALVSPTGFAFRGPAQNDCNDNLTLDSCDISGGGSADADSNGTPDECEGSACSCGDLNGSGSNVDLGDFAIFGQCFGLTFPSGSCDTGKFFCSDLTGDGTVDLSDFATFAVLFGSPPAGTPPACGP